MMAVKGVNEIYWYIHNEAKVNVVKLYHTPKLTRWGFAREIGIEVCRQITRSLFVAFWIHWVLIGCIAIECMKC